ncbi:hypothetical protein P3T76_014163 [Phytophthora citrophthora]|uniref:Uncharacterized protein n=1 Tax=Phytophthora citrophthora TaxID=4793 RepID=A0AAD9G312_9STRA|nr:hypothetical protein P3T76_014163 [Phytophthora citrophthora]
MARTTCRGLTKLGLPCSVTWGLTFEGYCKFHVPSASQCRGVARTTGRRCRIKWDLDQSGYCLYHKAQSGGLQCIAIAQSTGQRCQNTVGIDCDGFCSAHNPSNSSTPTCQGTVANSNVLCRYPAKPGYKYCCAAHDSSIKYYSPSLFRDPNLRSHKESGVVKLYNGRDLYHGDRLDLANSEMDHILENQCFSHAFHYIQFRDDREDVDFLASLVKEDIVNELPNLCFTRAATNKIKGAAVWKFLDDCLTGHVGYRGTATFNDYLLAENRDAVRLGRETTRVISGEMGIALKFCQRRLADQGETPEIDALSAQLQRLYVRMQLHTARGAVVRATARTKSQQTNVISGSRCLESIGGAVETSLRADAATFTPRAVQVGNSANQSGINARTGSEDTLAVELSHLSVDLPTDAIANNALDGSVSGDRIATNKGDSKSAVPESTQVSTKTETLDASAKPFLPHPVRSNGSPQHCNQRDCVNSNNN